MPREEPFQLTPLDNVVPPVWEAIYGGVNPEDVPVIDEATRLRPTTGSDPVNYFVRQRSEGDLFKRDLVLQGTIRGIADYLAARQGLTYSLPMIRIPSETSVAFGSAAVTAEIDGYWVVGYTINIATTSGFSASSVELQIVNTITSAVLYSRTATARATQVWAVSQNAVSGFRGQFLSEPLEFRLLNNSGISLVLSASLVMSPKMTSEADSDGDTEEGSALMLDDSVSRLMLDDSVSALILN